MHIYEVRPRKDKRGVHLISDVMPFRRLWSGEPNAITNTIGYAKFYSRPCDAVIRVYNEADTSRDTRSNEDEVKEQYRFCSGRLTQHLLRLAVAGARC